MKLYQLDIVSAAELLSKGEITSEELTKSVLERAQSLQPVLNSYITLTCDNAIERAKAVDVRRKNGEQLSVLAGIPAAVKDNICTKGILTTCASKMLGNFMPSYNATVIDRLDECGGVYIGKTNMDEFAMGSSGETSFFGASSNPYALDCVPGGSSSGSAAAVASDSAIYALGTDTGGSVRQPGALCGTVAMKPTYGRISRYGVVAFASSLDQVGIFTKSVKDCSLVMSAVCGWDKRDSTSFPLEKEDFSGGIDENIKGMRIGIPRQYFGDGVSAEVKESVLAAAYAYEKMGAFVEECDLDMTHYALPAYYLISSAEASSNLGRYDGLRYGFCSEDIHNFKEFYTKTRSEGFGKEVKRRILLGTYILQAGYYDKYYAKAQKVRALISNEYERVFKKYDLLITPASPFTAWKKGEKLTDVVDMYASDICTVSVNIAGLPAIVLPCGYDKSGKPIGMQLIGPSLSEKSLLRAAHSFEQTFAKRRPNF